MKFQKYLRELELDGSSRLPSLNYKLLKSEVKELICEVEAGHVSHAEVRERFASRLGDELEAVGDPWASHVRLLSARASEFFRASETLLCGDFLHESFCDDLRPLMLLEPLKPWLEVAAWADSLRRHRLLQAAAVVKIEKKIEQGFVWLPTSQSRPRRRRCRPMQPHQLTEQLSPKQLAPGGCCRCCSSVAAQRFWWRCAACPLPSA
mmetsp:Transcript_150418/g.481433  ORF Transcript_150418/g.481433 Transcript_150418/m.481433 type:complete len:207 (-) Transcript_150418:861-1481(-)